MRAWILATIALGALAAFLAVRQASFSKQIKSLQQDKEALTAQQQALTERLERAEEKLDGQREQVASSPGNFSASLVADGANLPKRVTVLENQVRALQGRLSPEYDPTIATAEPDPDTNAPPKRNWGPEQALGPPDTERDADSVTAWTSLETDNGPEWLSLGFNQTVELAQVRIRESYNAGAITKVTTVANGAEIILWEGNSARGKAPRDFVVNPPAGTQANSVIIYLDTKRVAGWNEIDAVELVGRDGSRQWATSASASSTYADRAGAAQAIQFDSFRYLSR